MNERQLIKKMGIFTDETRLKLIYTLSLNNFCSIHLEKLLSVSQPNISRHIDKMVTSGIVDIIKDGRRNVYCLNKDFKKNNSQIIKEISDVYSGLFNEEEFKKTKEDCNKLISKKK